jgi:hypothetical protein
VLESGVMPLNLIERLMPDPRNKMTNNKKAAVLLDAKEQDKRNLF